jgi:hypothetical protein
MIDAPCCANNLQHGLGDLYLLFMLRADCVDMVAVGVDIRLAWMVTVVVVWWWFLRRFRQWH